MAEVKLSEALAVISGSQDCRKVVSVVRCSENSDIALETPPGERTGLWGLIIAMHSYSKPIIWSRQGKHVHICNVLKHLWL